MATDSNQQQPPPQDAADRQQEEPSQPASAASGGSSTSQTAKSVYIFRNGDVFAPSKKFVLNRRQLRDWDNFLEQVTMSVNPLRGAVRAIVTPKRGRRRIQDLDSFDDKAHYVALAKGERFKPMTYVPEGEVAGGGGGGAAATGGSPNASPRRPAVGNRVVLQPILPVVHNKKLMSVQPRFGTKMDVISSQSKVIRVYRNGDEFTPAIITMLRPSEQVSMEVVLRAIEERVVLQNNMAIRKLYDLNGRRVREPKDLQHEKFYVAAGHEAFMPRPYGQKLPVIIMGKAERLSSIKYLSQPITPEKHSSRKSKAEQQEQAAAAASGKGAGSQQKKATPEEKAKAASQIQASAKGFQTRKEAAEKQSGGPVTIKPDAANSKANAKAKANNSKANAKAKPTPTKEEQQKSASAIQASVKGFESRKEAATKLAKKPIDIKNDPANSKKASAGQGQSGQGQKQQQKPMTKEEKAAAQSIEASVNSYKTRKTVANQEAARRR